MYPKIQLKPRKEKGIERNHLWVFSGAIKDKDDEVQSGSTVQVVASKGRFLGIGHYNDVGGIAIRMLSFEDIAIDQEFWNQRIENAYRLRKKCNVFSQEQNIFRLVHAEGDLLPGLIVDIYDKSAVIQCYSLGIYQHLEEIQQAIEQIDELQLETIHCKCKEIKGEEKIEDFNIKGSANTTEALENGIRYAIDWEQGQKSGFFIDQRDNRALLSRYSKEKSVLNTYSYTGGFSLSALQGGASSVHSVDSSNHAIQTLEQNMELNQYKDHESYCMDVLDFLKEKELNYDIIVLDPPAFAKHKRSKHNAVQGYKRINGYALRNINPGGLLFTFSCSQVVDTTLFRNTVLAAAIASERKVRIIHQLHQPQDHPINIYHPETEYLKGLVLQVD